MMQNLTLIKYKIKLNGMGYALLIDSSGVVLAHNNKSLIGRNMPWSGKKFFDRIVSGYDKALYQAKENGRDRVEIYTQTELKNPE